VARVEFFDGDELLGAREAPPWEITWARPAPGPHGVFAVWRTRDGGRFITNPGLVIVRHPL
jgi:hypothetical protein